MPSDSSVWKNTEGQTEVLSYLKTVSEGPAWQKDGLGWGSFLIILYKSLFAVACHNAALSASDLDENDKPGGFKNASVT